MKKKKKIKIINKKIYLNYNIKKKIIAGIILKGWEVKLIKKKEIDIKNSYIKIENKKFIYLTNYNINNYKKNIFNKKNKNRNIKILLKKKEIQYLYYQTKNKGYTLVPIMIQLKKIWFKIIIGLAKGKKKYNKKKDIKNKRWKKKNNIDF